MGHRKSKYSRKNFRVVDNIRRRKWYKRIRRKLKKYFPKPLIRTFLQEMCIAIGYHDLYNVREESLPMVKNLLTSMPVLGALNIINKMHKQVMYMTTNKRTQSDVIKQVLPYLEKNVQCNYHSFIKRVAKQKNRGVLLINNISELLLSYFVIQFGDRVSKEFELNNEQQKNLYKALLCCNDIYTKEIVKIDNCNSIIRAHGIEGMEVKLDLPLSEFKRDKQIVEPIYKAFAFFKYCENDLFWKSRIDKMCKAHNVKSWLEYLEIIIALISSYMRDGTEELNVESLRSVDDFMGNYIVSDTPVGIDIEKKSSIQNAINFLRTQFLWKLREGRYLPLNHNLLIDLIYQSIKFDLLKIMEQERDELVEQKKKDGYSFPKLEQQDDRHVLKYIKSELKKQGGALSDEEEKIITRSFFIGLNGEFGQNFSQQYILEPLMQLTFGEPSVHLKEKDMEAFVDAPSDYYVRVNDALYLFELKDTYLNDDVKYSQDIQTALYGYEKEEKHVDGIADKICKDGITGRKGVPQLLNSIVQIINNKKLDSIDSEASSVRHIYPIVITTDMAFSANGINAFVIKKYREELRKQYPIIGGVEVHLPTIVNIDFFIRYSEMLFNHKISLRRILNQYFSTKAYKLTSFDAFTFDFYKSQYNSENCIKHLQIGSSI